MLAVGADALRVADKFGAAEVDGDLRVITWAPCLIASRAEPSRSVRKALDKASDPAEIIQVAMMLDAIENLMHAAGLFDLDDIIP